jgi:hypothetical protein
MDHNMVSTLSCGRQQNQAGNFDHHANAKVQCGGHCPIEHIPGFTRSHWMLPLGKSLGGIALAAAMVDDFDCKRKNTNKKKY